jgi:hypothetical protein
MHLVQNWKQAYRWWSVRGLAALAALPLVWQTLPPDLKAFLPDGWEPWVLAALALGTLAGRLVQQTPPAAP